ncbi:MAG: hypothetical protein U0M72_07410 [Eggerthellaceae bacterium]
MSFIDDKIAYWCVMGAMLFYRRRCPFENAVPMHLLALLSCGPLLARGALFGWVQCSADRERRADIEKREFFLAQEGKLHYSLWLFFALSDQGE